MTEPRSALEETVIEAARVGRAELIALATDLVAFDTTARGEADAPRDEEKLQRYLGKHLSEIGAEVEIWEPEPIPASDPFVPGGLDFKGRPQLVGRLPGKGKGPSLLLNGHIDAVTAEPRELWTSDPFKATERGGHLFGRGVNDMKGGLATMLFALKILQRLDVRLHGDVIYCANTDEESSGAGGYACVAHGVRADAGICAEPSGFDVWTACRGSLYVDITVPGRAGHAEMAQPGWQDGGAVNAIDKLRIVLEAIAALDGEWRTRPDKQHPLLSPGNIVPTMIKGGVWTVTHPPTCELHCGIYYHPGELDSEGTGSAVRDEFTRRIEAAVAGDSWLASHPLVWEWSQDTIPAEVPQDHPIVQCVQEAAGTVGRESRVSGFDSWHDAAAFTRLAGTPTVSFGPGGVESAHSVDE